jgi:hypothetical protein
MPTDKVKDNPITSEEDWVNDVTEAAPLRVSERHTVLARNPGMEVFLQAGIIPNSLLPIIQEALKRGQAPDMKQLVEDNPNNWQIMLDLTDAVVCFCVVEPTVRPEPVDEQGNKRIDMREKNPDTGKPYLYVGMVDPEEKMFIFQWAVGGLSDYQKFRKEYRKAVATVSDGAGASSATKSRPRPAPTKRTGAAPRKRK